MFGCSGSGRAPTTASVYICNVCKTGAIDSVLGHGVSIYLQEIVYHNTTTMKYRSGVYLQENTE